MHIFNEKPALSVVTAAYSAISAREEQAYAVQSSSTTRLLRSKTYCIEFVWRWSFPNVSAGQNMTSMRRSSSQCSSAASMTDDYM